MERYDIAIIGTGPAGLSAAITSKIRNKKIIVLGSKDLSTKIAKAHEVQNYLGLPNITGSEMQKAFSDHIQKMGIEITEARVSAIYPMGDYFGIQASGDIYEATSVIIATGIVVGNKYDGEDAFLGKGVSYCATCDAPLYKNKTVAVIGFGVHEEAEANFLCEVAAKVYYFPMYKDEVNLSEKIEVIREIPKSIIGENIVQKLETDKNSYKVDGIFILREAIAPNQLLSGIEIVDNHIQVNRKMETNVKGCFACGDVVGTPYQYIKSAGEGNIAALSAVNYLSQKK